MSKEKAKGSPKNVGISAEVPCRVRDELFRLAKLTNSKASHHVRMALVAYLQSDAANTMREEAERFSSITKA